MDAKAGGGFMADDFTRPESYLSRPNYLQCLMLGVLEVASMQGGLASKLKKILILN